MFYIRRILGFLSFSMDGQLRVLFVYVCFVMKEFKKSHLN